VFAVGTGTAANARRTGFLIDSGSNTRISGSLNVNGNTIITGSVTLSGSAGPELIVVGDTQMSGSVDISGSLTAKGLTFASLDYNSLNGQIQMNATGSSGKIVLKSENVSISSSVATTVTGSLEITSGSGDLFMYGHKMFNVGAFSSIVTQSGSANVSQSIAYDVTDYSQGVSVVSGTRLTVANAGVYNIQFSAQIDRTSGSGTDTVYIWLKKNGNNVTNSAGAITISGGAAAAKTISSWNYVVDAAASDYYEICWQTTDSNIQLINAAASGNIPDIPSVIVTVTQVR